MPPTHSTSRPSGIRRVSLRPDYSAQLKRLKSRGWANVAIRNMLDTAGRQFDMVCLHLDSIDHRKCRVIAPLKRALPIGARKRTSMASPSMQKVQGPLPSLLRPPPPQAANPRPRPSGRGRRALSAPTRGPILSVSPHTHETGHDSSPRRASRRPGERRRHIAGRPASFWWGWWGGWRARRENGRRISWNFPRGRSGPARPPARPRS
jgi:hypothetical protein